MSAFSKYMILVSIGIALGVYCTLLAQRHMPIIQMAAARLTELLLVGGTRAGMELSDRTAYLYAILGATGMLSIVGLYRQSKELIAGAKRWWVNREAHREWDKAVKVMAETPKNHRVA